MMEASYSAWNRLAKDSLVIGGDSFYFLFDRRYTNRLNRMSRVFFEAYVKATKEVSAEEDRFPSLSEIESRMESGAIYAYKDRLMRNTEFFEEIKISGISYLIPRARQFVDQTGTYTNLMLDFDEEKVFLPKRRKVPLASPPGEGETEEEEGEPESEVFGLTGVDEENEEAAEEPEEFEDEFETLEEGIEEEPQEVEEKAEEPQMREEKAEKKPGSEHVVVEQPELSAEIGTAEAESAEPKPPESKIKYAEPPEVPPPEEPNTRKIDIKGGRGIIGLVALAVLILLAVYFLSPFSPSPYTPPKPLGSVHYAAYLVNTSENNTYLNLEVINPSGLQNVIEIVLPPDIDKSISATGGIVSISYSDNTVIQLNSSNDASVSARISGNLEHVPVVFNLTIPSKFDSSLQVYEKDYQVTRIEDTIVLTCNCSKKRLEFEQVYYERVIGPGGTQERSPDNSTESP